MVKCICGKDVEKAPAWLDGVNVRFVCNSCPNREAQPQTVLSGESKDPRTDVGSIDGEED